MIRFACPSCNKSLKAPDDGAGRKVNCPRCGQRLMVPPPTQTRSKTVLGRPRPSEAVSSSPSPPNTVLVICPDCGRMIDLPAGKLGTVIECAECDRRFTASTASEEAEPDDADDSRTEQRDHEKSSREKYCVECGAIIRTRAAICPECGVSQTDVEGRKKKHCHECGAIIRGKAVVCPECGVEQESSASASSETAGNSNRIAAGVLAILLGFLGIHKFILGYTGAGIIMLLVSLLGVCLYGLGPFVMAVIGLVEGILYLSMSDQQFQKVHGKRQRPWF